MRPRMRSAEGLLEWGSSGGGAGSVGGGSWSSKVKGISRTTSGTLEGFVAGRVVVTATGICVLLIGPLMFNGESTLPTFVEPLIGIPRRLPTRVPTPNNVHAPKNTIVALFFPALEFLRFAMVELDDSASGATTASGSPGSPSTLPPNDLPPLAPSTLTLGSETNEAWIADNRPVLPARVPCLSTLHETRFLPISLPPSE